MKRDWITAIADDWMLKQRKTSVFTGRLVVENGQVSLQLDAGELVELNTNDRIEVLNGDRFEPAPFSRILERVDSTGWALYAGLYASVTRRSRNPTEDEVFDHCPICDKKIHFGQVAWKVGPELCCSVEHMLTHIKESKERGRENRWRFLIRSSFI